VAVFSGAILLAVVWLLHGDATNPIEPPPPAPIVQVPVIDPDAPTDDIDEPDEIDPDVPSATGPDGETGDGRLEFDPLWNQWTGANGSPDFSDLPLRHQPEAIVEAAMGLNEWMAQHQGVLDSIVSGIDCDEPPCIIECRFDESAASSEGDEDAVQAGFVQDATTWLQEETGIPSFNTTLIEDPDGVKHLWVWAVPEELDPQGELSSALGTRVRNLLSDARDEIYLSRRGQGEIILDDGD